VLAAILALPLFAGAAEAEKKPKKGVNVSVMTRNLFLGADLTAGLTAPGPAEFVAANGGILREVTQTNFPLRAQGLAAEIAEKKPNLIGLQEVALWRTATPASFTPATSGQPTATTVRYDFLQLLLDQLAAQGQNYTPAVVNQEFDFEAPADENGVPGDGPFGAELNGRLTMRDVILVRQGGPVKVKVANPTMGHFTNLFTPNVSGVDVPVTRGWAALDATATKGKGKKRQRVKFRFVDTHFEAFDDETQVPSIRAQQAQELTQGPAVGKKVIVVGDLNSDVPGVKPGDEQAFQTMLDAGFRDLGTTKPLSCCVSNLFTSPPSEFDHRVDHVLTNAPKKKVTELTSSVTGLEQANGIYDSDHAGVFSKLKIR
jgi:endonuclease/exonuclease/phosphatase family metal-dependent hydrolase